MYRSSWEGRIESNAAIHLLHHRRNIFHLYFIKVPINLPIFGRFGNYYTLEAALGLNKFRISSLLTQLIQTARSWVLQANIAYFLSRCILSKLVLWLGFDIQIIIQRSLPANPAYPSCPIYNDIGRPGQHWCAFTPFFIWRTDRILVMWWQSMQCEENTMATHPQTSYQTVGLGG